MSPEQMLVSRGFDFAIPEILTPGGLAIISHSAVSKKFNEFLEKPKCELFRHEIRHQKSPALGLGHAAQFSVEFRLQDRP